MITVARIIRRTGGWVAAVAPLAAWLALSASFSWGGKAATKPALKNAKLPGIVINFQDRFVDVDSLVRLDEGTLELIACTKGSKEHESIVAIEAKAMHIHASLLLLGARPGNPAMQKPVNKEKTRWVHLEPAGDPVGVSLAFKDKKGKLVERPISDFVASSDGEFDKPKADEKKARFPDTFLFAGSLLIGDGAGRRKYMSDVNGNVISISTFGDELLCLPGIHGQQDGSLPWRVDATKLPKVGSKVMLRLRPKRRAASTTRPKPKKQHHPRNRSSADYMDK